jgi:hypothetical protein
MNISELCERQKSVCDSIELGHRMMNKFPICLNKLQNQNMLDDETMSPLDMHINVIEQALSDMDDDVKKLDLMIKKIEDIKWYQEKLFDKLQVLRLLVG